VNLLTKKKKKRTAYVKVDLSKSKWNRKKNKRCVCSTFFICRYEFICYACSCV